MTIHLPPDIELLIEDAARRRGTLPELLAIDELRKLFAEPTSQPSSASGSLLEFLGDDVGSVKGIGEPISESCGARFVQCLTQDRQAGRV